MEGWAIALIVILLLIIIGVGVGVAVYIIEKDKKNNNGGTTGTNPPGPSGPTGATGSNPPGGPTGSFSISPVSQPNSFMTFTSGSTAQVPMVIVDSGNTGACSRFSWQNIANFNNGSRIVSSALVSNVNPATIPGFNPSPQPNLLTNGETPDRINYLVIINQGISVPDDPKDNQSWTYNSTNKTWCAVLDNTLCLYFNTDNNVIMKFFDPSDNRFQWNNVTPITAPRCIP